MIKGDIGYRENKAGEGQGGCEGRLFSHTVVSALCDPMDCSTPGSAVCGVSQARILEGVAMASARDLPAPGFKPASLTSQDR